MTFKITLLDSLLPILILIPYSINHSLLVMQKKKLWTNICNIESHKLTSALPVSNQILLHHSGFRTWNTSVCKLHFLCVISLLFQHSIKLTAFYILQFSEDAFLLQFACYSICVKHGQNNENSISEFSLSEF